MRSRWHDEAVYKPHDYLFMFITGHLWIQKHRNKYKGGDIRASVVSCRRVTATMAQVNLCAVLYGKRDLRMVSNPHTWHCLCSCWCILCYFFEMKKAQLIRFNLQLLHIFKRNFFVPSLRGYNFINSNMLTIFFPQENQPIPQPGPNGKILCEWFYAWIICMYYVYM